MSADRPVILYQDSALLAVDKPAGMHTAPLRPGEKGTLLGLVIEAFPEVAGLPGMKEVEPGLVHRLDRGTSGVVVVARTAEAFDALRAIFDGGGARKTYLAACGAGAAGAAARGPLSIQSRFAPLGAGRRKVRVVTPGTRGRRILREATRELYTTRAQIAAEGPGRLLLRVTIERGFRHQVRAHLAHLGYPILGDELYGVEVPAGFPRRMYLHAAAIDLVHPLTGKALRLVSPVPVELGRLYPECETWKGVLP
jgi:23S rRNA pseudouridine1911/1915/1917 synthase